MTELDLTPYAVQRPEQMIWRFPTNLADPLDGIRSKSLRIFLRRSDAVLSESQTTYVYKPVTISEFEEWLVYYKAKMTENGYRVLATKEWYETRTAKGYLIEGVFFYRNEELICSGIFTRDGLEKATFAFKASDRIEFSGRSNASIGSLSDYFFLKKMYEMKVKVISAGKSQNAFGVHNTLGYLDYKLRFGYQPRLAEPTPLLSTVPVSEEGRVLFYGVKDGRLSLYSLKPKGDVFQVETARFGTPELPFVEIEY